MLSNLLLFIAAVANDNVSVSSQRLPDTSPPDRDQVSSEYLRTSESSTTSSATDADPRESATAAAEQPAGAGADRCASGGGDTDATTCDTVSATMWFDRPEVTTSFVTCDASDDDDADSVNSNNNYNDEDGKNEFCFVEAYRIFYLFC